MSENLEEIKQELIQQDFSLNRQEWFQDMRQRIMTRVLQDIRFENQDKIPTGYNLAPQLEKVIQEIQETNWSDILRELNRGLGRANFPLYSSWETELEKCGRCQAYHLRKSLSTCAPSGKNEDYGDYCRPCIDAWHKEINTAFINEIVPCIRCNQNYPRYVLRNSSKILIDIPITNKEDYCQPCAEKIRDAHHLSCSVCDMTFIGKPHVYGSEICSNCYTQELSRERQRVYDHKIRAEGINLESSLTLKSWLCTLNHFEWKCAYCLAPFTGLEHYLPLSLGGGTTQDNCLPSCHYCNVRKNDKHPDDFTKLFPPASLARIQDYFAGLSQVA